MLYKSIAMIYCFCGDMVRFETINDLPGYLMVIVDDRMRIGLITSTGKFLISQNPKELDYDGQMDSEDLMTIYLKAKEISRFRNNIPVCEYCGGTPAFPKNDCEAGNHGLLDENDTL